MNTALRHNYVREDLKVSDLYVDKRVQRDQLQEKKVEQIVANFNPNAVGVIHVSRRIDGDYVIDGWHRMRAIQLVSDNNGTIAAHVYKGLSLAEEARMFLDLNFGNQPTPLEKHKAMVAAEDEQALRVERAVRTYGWVIGRESANGTVPAIRKLYQIDVRSESNPDGPRDPSLLQMVFLTVSRAWLTDKYAAQAVILEALGRLWEEYGSQIDLDRLVDRLKNFAGGPRRLRREAQQMSVSLGVKVSMAIAMIVVEAYNKGYRDNSAAALPPWRKRS